MVIANLYLDNIYSFDDFTLNLTYPKKIVNSTIENECLKDFKNFRFKKLNILLGSNATGKTSLGMAIWHICMFMSRKEADHLIKMVCNKNREAKIVFDYIIEKGKLNRIDIVIKPVLNENNKVLIRYNSIDLNKNDSYESAVKRISEKDYVNYVEGLTDIEFKGWKFVFPLTEANFDRVISPYDDEKDKEEFLNILIPILKTLDPLIKNVSISQEIQRTYIIEVAKGEKFFVSHGMKLSEIPILSSGTKYGFNIASILFDIKKHQNRFYFVDEQFSYINSEIEIALLNLMVNYLGEDEQLFFTSHNSELLALNYPAHSFTFLRKVKKNESLQIEAIDASFYEKRNNVNLKNLYDNDFFNVSPDLSQLYNLWEE